jgi:hypothetical protein
VQRIAGRGTISRCIWITRSSRVSRFAGRWDAARQRRRDRRELPVEGMSVSRSAMSVLLVATGAKRTYRQRPISVDPDSGE